MVVDVDLSEDLMKTPLLEVVLVFGLVIDIVSSREDNQGQLNYLVGWFGCHFNGISRIFILTPHSPS